MDQIGLKFTACNCKRIIDAVVGDCCVGFPQKSFSLYQGGLKVDFG